MQDTLSYMQSRGPNGLPGNKFLAVRTSTAAHLQGDLAPANLWESIGKCPTTITLCTSRLAEAIAANDTLHNSDPLDLEGHQIL